MSECFYGDEQNKTLYFLKCLLQLHLLNSLFKRFYIVLVLALVSS